MLNLFEIKPGQRVRLKSGAVCDVLDNPGDGIWLQLRTPGQPGDGTQDGAEELVHCEEMVALVEPAKA